MNVTRLSVRTIAALGAGLALVLASCGGGDDDAADSTSTTSDSTTTAATEPPSDTTQPAEPTTSPASPTLADQDGNGSSVTIAGGDSALADDTITIADFAFRGVTEVPVGTTVVVTNTDATPHTWTAEGGSFDAGAIAPGESFEFTFTQAGEFAYFCNFHPSMTGTIVVTP